MYYLLENFIFFKIWLFLFVFKICLKSFVFKYILNIMLVKEKNDKIG